MTEARTAWGDPQTRYFFELTPDRVLSAVEEGVKDSGLLCTGRCFTLNSFENRVYDVELEDSEGRRSRRIGKFYRPGRWTREQILEEHEFLADLLAQEIPAIAPMAFADGSTLRMTESGIYYALFPRVGGRAPEELSDEQLVRVGRLLGRIHNVGAARAAPHRLQLGPETYGEANLRYLLEGGHVPLEYRARYQAAVEAVCARATEWFRGVAPHRIHGDCHLGNLLWNAEGPFFLDFDDMVRGPAVQDVWLLVPGRDAEARRQREVLLSGYEELRNFDRSTLRLVEVLRALRFVHYTAWIARRWEDPAFPAAFPHFGTHRYWQDETADLEQQVRLLSDASL